MKGLHVRESLSSKLKRITAYEKHLAAALSKATRYPTAHNIKAWEAAGERYRMAGTDYLQGRLALHRSLRNR